MDKIKIEYVVDGKRFSDESLARKYAMEVEEEKQRKEKLNKEKEAIVRVNEIVQAKESLEKLYCQFVLDYYDTEILTFNAFDILFKEVY